MKKLSLFFATVFATVSAHSAIISRIDVNGNLRMDDESVRILSGVKIGDNLSAEDINQIAKKLQNSGYFSAVSATISNGILKINLTESPIIDQVTIEGNDEVSADDLRKELLTKPRTSFDESVIGGDIARILTVYQRKGFFGTRVNPQKIDAGNGRVNVVFMVSEGHPTRIRDIDFDGNENFSDRTLRGEIMSREYAWWRFMTQFDVYDEERIGYDAHMVRQFYLRNGYADAVVINATGEFSSDRKYYSAQFKVNEGKKFEFGELTIKNPFPDVPDRELERALTADSGDTYNIDLVESSIMALRAVVAKYGYAFINVEPVPKKNDETQKIDIEFQIAKTNRVYLNSVNILGNVRTFDNVIEQMVPLRSGDPFSLQSIEDGRQRLMRSGFFKDVQMVPTRNADSNTMNLDIKVEEQPTGELSGSVGWSNINGFMVDAGITENNFMGRGQTVQLKASIAQYMRQAMFSWTEPYLFDRALSGGFDVAYTMYNYESLGSYDYNRDSMMIAGRLGWKLTENWTQTLRLSAMFDKNYDPLRGGWSDSNLFALSTNLRYYNLDTDFAQNTHTGIVADLGVSYTGFGSTETFMKYTGTFTGLVKFFDSRWQLKVVADAGAIQTLGDDDYISRVYRYFLGGESLRGFDIAGVGSRYGNNNYAFGGLWKINGTVQLNFPIFIPDEYNVKGFVFADYGILGKPPKQDWVYAPDFIDADLRTSAGVGVYWKTPMGPMNFSWGWPLKMNEYDREQRFLLSFESSF